MSRARGLSTPTLGILLAALTAWGGALPATAATARAASGGALPGIAATAPSPCPPFPASVAPSVASLDLPAGELTVFAAASLADILDGLEERWLERAPGVPLTAAFDASNVLATQIAEGAEVDVFLSADLQRPTALAEAGLAAGHPVVFARTRLIIVTPLEAGPVQVATDLAAPGVRLVAALPDVPITRYAEMALAQLAATAADPAGFTSEVEANVVSREDNVRAALAKVELGEGDAAIVYVTDARSSELVREVPFPEGIDVSADYGGVQVSSDPAAAAFLAWLAGPEALSVLTEAGFETPE